MSSLLAAEPETDVSLKPTFTESLRPTRQRYITLGEDSPDPPSESKSKESDGGIRRLKIASVICIFFVIAEFVAGIIAKSTAVQADAAHMLTDFFSFIISLIALNLAKRPKSKRFTYGWGRAEIIGALFSIVTLWIITGILGYMAVEKIRVPETELNEMIMIYIASAAIVFNLILGFVLHGSGHGHSHHGHSHGHGHSDDAVNIRAAMVHIIGDLIQSVGVLVTGLVVKFYPGTKEQAVLADPICTLIFILIVVVTTFRIMYDLVTILMASVDPKITQKAEEILEQYASIAELNIWTMVPGKSVLTAKIALKKSYETSKSLLSYQPIVSEIETTLKKHLPQLVSVTIQTQAEQSIDTNDVSMSHLSEVSQPFAKLNNDVL